MHAHTHTHTHMHMHVHMHMHAHMHTHIHTRTHAHTHTHTALQVIGNFESQVAHTHLLKEDVENGVRIHIQAQVCL